VAVASEEVEEPTGVGAVEAEEEATGVRTVASEAKRSLSNLQL
jgi:hypothetical protein